MANFTQTDAMEGYIPKCLRDLPVSHRRGPSKAQRAKDAAVIAALEDCRHELRRKLKRYPQWSKGLNMGVSALSDAIERIRNPPDKRALPNEE